MTVRGLVSRCVAVVTAVLAVCQPAVGGAWGPLNALLGELVIPVGNYTTTVKVPVAGTVAVTLHNIVCTQLSLADLSVVETESTAKTAETTTVHVQGVKLSCTADYFVKDGILTQRGQMTAKSSDSSATVAIVAATENARQTFERFPPYMSYMSVCDSRIALSSLSLSGVLKLVESVIRRELNSVINPAICNELALANTTLLVPLLRNISKLLLGQPGQERAGGVRWKKQEERVLSELAPFVPNDLRTNPLVQLVNLVVDFFLDTAACGLPLGINQLVQAQIAKQANGQRDGLNISLGSRGLSLVKLVGSPVTDIIVNLTSVLLKGVDTFTSVHLLKPISGTTMNTTLALAGPVQIDVAATVVFAPKGGAPFVEHVVLSLPAMESVELQVSTLVAIDEGFYGDVPLQEFFEHFVGCSVRGVHAANVTAASWTVAKLTGSVGVQGMLSPDVDKVVASVGDAAARMYEGALLEGGGADHLMETLLLPLANEAIGTAIQGAIVATQATAVCNGSSLGPRPMPAEPPIDLSTSIPVLVLRSLVEDVLFPMVNGLIANATCGLNGEHGRLDTTGPLLGPAMLVVKNYDQVPQIGNVTIGLSNLTLENLDTIATLKAFEAPAPTRMDTTLVMAPVDTKPVRLSVDVLLKVKRIPGTDPDAPPNRTPGPEVINPNGDVEDRFRIGVTMNNLTLSTALNVAIDGYSLGALPLRATRCLSCWLGTLNTLGILGGGVDGFTVLQSRLASVDVACGHTPENSFGRPDDQLSCTSPAMPDFIRRSESTENVQQFANWMGYKINGVLSTFQTEVFQSHLQSILDQRRADGVPACMSDPVFAPAKDWVAPQCLVTKGALITYGVVGGVVLVYFFTLFFVRYFQVEHHRHRCRCQGCCCSCIEFCKGNACRQDVCWCRRLFCNRHQAEREGFVQHSELSGMRTTLLSVDEDSTAENTLPLSTEIMFTPSKPPVAREETGEALLFHHAIPEHVRMGMLVLIVINIGLFFTDHALTAASVNVGIDLLGNAFLDEQAFPFGLGYTLVNMWNACAVLLLGFMATFSGAWPYLKLLLMSALWCAPPAMLSPRARGRYFHMLDIMGKWSLLDLYVLVQAMVAFYVEIKNPKLDILPGKFYHLQVYIVPVYGLYSFCFAVVLSLVLSHAQVIYHLNAVTADAMIESQGRGTTDTVPTGLGATTVSWLDVGSNDTELESVAENARAYEHEANRGNSNIMRWLQCRAAARKRTWFVALAVAVALALMLVGATVPCWTFTTAGVAGLIAEVGEKGSTVRPYSMFSAFIQLVDQSTMGGQLAIGTLFITLVYILFAFVVPLVHMITLLFLWYRRLTLGGLKRLFLATQVLSAFSALEVWVLGTVFTILQIQYISYEVLDEQCTGLKPAFEALVNFGFIAPDDGNCFQINGEFHWFGLGLMFLSACVGHFISLTVCVEAGKSVKRRERMSLHWSPRTGVCYSVVERKAARRTKFVGTGGGAEGMNARVSFGQAMADLVEDGEL